MQDDYITELRENLGADVSEDLDDIVDNVITGTQGTPPSAIIGTQGTRPVSRRKLTGSISATTDLTATVGGASAYEPLDAAILDTSDFATESTNPDFIKNLDRIGDEAGVTLDQAVEGLYVNSYGSPYVDNLTHRELEKQQNLYDAEQDKLAELYGWGDITGTAIDQEWITSFGYQKDTQESVSLEDKIEALELQAEEREGKVYDDYFDEDFTLTPEIQVDFMSVPKDLQEFLNTQKIPDFYMPQMTEATSLLHLYKIKNKILRQMHLEVIINSHGEFKGGAARLLAAILDPAAITAIIASEGVAARWILPKKISRLARIIKGFGSGGLTIGAIEAYIAERRPDLEFNHVIWAALLGGTLGAGVGAFRGGRALNKRERLHTNIRTTRDMHTEKYLKPHEGIIQGSYKRVKGKKKGEHIVTIDKNTTFTGKLAPLINAQGKKMSGEVFQEGDFAIKQLGGKKLRAKFDEQGRLVQDEVGGNYTNYIGDSKWNKDLDVDNITLNYS